MNKMSGTATTHIANQPTADESPIAIYMPALADGGAEHAMCHLAENFLAQGLPVDFVVDENKGPNNTIWPDGVRVTVLKLGNKHAARLALLRTMPLDAIDPLKPILLGRKPPLTLRRLPALVDYLQQNRPRVLIALLAYTPMVAVWAARIANVGTPVLVSERHHFSSRFELAGEDRDARKNVRIMRTLMRRTYPRAAARVAVSLGVADDLAEQIRLPRNSIDVLYNPVVSPAMDRLARQSPDHPWFEDDTDLPVLLAVGRLVRAKDFETLIHVFARVRDRQAMRLVILGDGPERETLQTLIKTLGLSDVIDLPGWRSNPYALMARCSVFVSPSRREGLSNVLLEALYCGAPVVATDCPTGTAEILAAGTYGSLVPMQNTDQLAETILASWRHSIDPALTRARAEVFSVAPGAARWLDLIERVGHRT